MKDKVFSKIHELLDLYTGNSIKALAYIIYFISFCMFASLGSLLYQLPESQLGFDRILLVALIIVNALSAFISFTGAFFLSHMKDH